MSRLPCFIAALLLAGAAQAQVYKCIGAGGRVVYSQDPCPPSAKSEPVSRNLDPAPAAAAPDAKAAPAGAAKAAEPKLTPEQAFEKRQAERTKADQEAQQKLAQTKQKEENCRAARDQLTQYEIGGRISRIDSQGNRVYLDDSQIEQQRQQARDNVAKACN